MRHILLLLVASTLLVGCGKKGDLYLPTRDDGSQVRAPVECSDPVSRVAAIAPSSDARRARG